MSIIFNWLKKGVKKINNSVSNLHQPKINELGYLNSKPEINKIVSVTPAGRKRNLEILVPYLLKNKNIINNHIFWINTENDVDINFIKDTCNKYPDYFSFIESKIKINGNESILQFYEYCQDINTIYIKIDDDICFFEKNAIENLIQFRLNNPQYFLVMGNIINNSICSFIHQKFGNIPNFNPPIEYSCDDIMGWQSPLVARIIHEKFIKDVKDLQISKYFFDKWILNDFNRFSINFFCWFGKDFQEFDGKVGKTDSGFINDDEEWLTVYKTKKDDRCNIICGNSIVSHFSFFTQREYLESHTRLLDSYKVIAFENNSSN